MFKPLDAAGAPALSIVIPAYNEGAAIRDVLERLLHALEPIGDRSTVEVVVVDDASKDDTAEKVRAVPGVRLISNPVNLGYGHTLLRGIAAARADVIGIIDADGTYPPEAIPGLFELICKGADHAIGGRTGKNFQRLWSLRHYYRWLCRYVVGQHVPDANSGLRLFRRTLVENLRGDLCLGFSFTTSLTLASIMSGYVVTFTPIAYDRRVGRSHVRPRDILRTLQYLFQLIALYNPLKFFLPLVVACLCSAVIAFGYGLYLERIGGMISGVVMLATTFMLTGLAGHAYIVSRIGVRPAPLRHSESALERALESEDRQRSDQRSSARLTPIDVAPTDAS